MKPTKKWLLMAELYRKFAGNDPALDWSDKAKDDMFIHESCGNSLPETRQVNGYFMGKWQMDAIIKMWKEDISLGILLPIELQREYPCWFLERIGINQIVPNTRWYYEKYT